MDTTTKHGKEGGGDAGREARGRALARRSLGRIRWTSHGYIVPSSKPASPGYLVDIVDSRCTCPDHELHKMKCKHIHAVEFSIAWQGDGDGRGSDMCPPKITYPQNWPAYNAAQVNEQDDVEVLLRGLCEGVQQPQQRMGRPRLLLRDVVYSAVLKVYGTMSGRRAQSDIRDCRAKGHLSVAPSYNSIFRAIEDPALTPLLKSLIMDAALPLQSIEWQFSQDSTGFSTCNYTRWFDEKFGGERKSHDFVKLHAMIGTLTNVVTAADVTDRADCPMLEPLLAETLRAGFNVQEVSADKAYLSKRNVELIRAAGAMPYIPFKDNSTGKGPAQWREMFAMYMLRRPEFLAHYHRRSNVETTFWRLCLRSAPRGRLLVQRG